MTAAKPASPVGGERDAFEAYVATRHDLLRWMRAQLCDNAEDSSKFWVKRNTGRDTYYFGPIQSLWEGWQGHAASTARREAGEGEAVACALRPKSGFVRDLMRTDDGRVYLLTEEERASRDGRDASWDTEVVPLYTRGAAPSTPRATVRVDRFDCATCGAGVKADEDGCCATCGRECAIAKGGDYANLDSSGDAPREAFTAAALAEQDALRAVEDANRRANAAAGTGAFDEVWREAGQADLALLKATQDARAAYRALSSQARDGDGGEGKQGGAK